MLEHSYGERCHRLRHREDVSTDVDDPATLDASAIVNDHVDPFDAQPTVIGEFGESVDGRVQPHHLMLLDRLSILPNQQWVSSAPMKCPCCHLPTYPMAYGGRAPRAFVLFSSVPALPEPAWPLSDGIVALRRFTLEDIPDVTRACQDPEIPRWTAGIPQPYEEHHAQEWIARHDTMWAEGTRAPFAFCWATDGELLGAMTVGDIDLDRRSGAAGYWAAPWARNRGATTRALRLACRWAFDALDLEIVDLMTIPGNQASERVAEKAGFTLVELLADYKPSGALDPDALYEVNHWVLRHT